MNCQYPKSGNIFSELPNKALTEEQFEILFRNKNIKIERIISTGQTTPENEWYNQGQDEWVILLKGNARILFFDEIEVKLTHLLEGETEQRLNISQASSSERSLIAATAASGVSPFTKMSCIKAEACQSKKLS